MSEIDTIQNDNVVVALEPNLSSLDTSSHDDEVETSEVSHQENVHTSTTTGIETRDNNGENVTAVVTKAKRAATFLWTLLHAQVCKSCSTNQCHYSGCVEAKRLLLHIKTCPANGEVACPSGHNGCQQSRKLLNHYRKCREERARQRRQARLSQPNNFCLICTLLARHDKTISENSLAISSPLLQSNHQKRNTQPSNSLSSSFDKIYSPQVARRKARSKSVQFDLHRETKSADSPSAMPPPPPRSRTSSVGSISHFDQHSIGSSVTNIHSFLHQKDGMSRPRAESLDERKLPSPGFDNDPTVELELRLRSQSSSDVATMDMGGRGNRQLPFRKRSVSCSLIPHGSKSPNGCETIMEE